MTRYVLCFLFNRPRTHVVLLQKRRPAWQSGKLNGPGGVIEHGESVEVAASREFKEETGVEVPDGAWRRFATLEFPDAEIHCVETTHPDEYVRVRAATDEIPTLAAVARLHELPRVDDVDVLVHLALARMRPVTLCRST